MAKSFLPNVWLWNNGTTPFRLQMPPLSQDFALFLHAVLANLRPLGYESFHLIPLIRVFNHFFPVLFKIHFYFYLCLCECMHHAVPTEAEKGVVSDLQSILSHQTWVLGTELSSSGKAASTNFNSIMNPISILLTFWALPEKCTKAVLWYYYKSKFTHLGLSALSTNVFLENLFFHLLLMMVSISTLMSLLDFKTIILWKIISAFKKEKH